MVCVSAMKQSGSLSDYDVDFPCAKLTLVHAAVTSTQQGYTNCPANGVLVALHVTSSLTTSSGALSDEPTFQQ